MVLSHSVNASDLILKVDEDGDTALHFASTKEVSQLLVETVDKLKTPDLLWSTSKDPYRNKFTPLDNAVNDDRVDVVEYLCSLGKDNPSLLKGGCYLPSYTPLHEATSKKVAKVLIASVPEKNQLSFLLSKDEVHWTPLHRAVMANCYEVAEYLCSLSTDLIFCGDRWGYTALHKVKTLKMAKLLVEAVPLAQRESYITSINVDRRIVFCHYK